MTGLRSAIGVALLGMGAVRVAAGQSGRVAGTVRSSDGAPLPGSTVIVVDLAISTQTSDSGAFAFGNVPAGEHRLSVLHMGHRPALSTAVVVRAGEVTRVEIQLEATPMLLGGVVVSVSRRAESVIDAPAAVTKFDEAAIGDGLGSASTNLLKQAPGVDLTQVGVLTSFVNGRGFNKVFNSRWLTIEDGRVAALAETGLSIGEHTPIAKIDIADIEVIGGPESALYGANASGGVQSVRTKDPREHPGLAMELTGGSQQMQDIQGRYAGSRGRWAYKVAAQQASARDWVDTVRYPAITVGGPTLPEAPHDADTHTGRVSGSVRFDLDSAAHLALNVGASDRDALGQTSQGRYRIEDYQYQEYQLLLRSPRWFAQVYHTHSNSGRTYRLNIFTSTRAQFPALTDDSVHAIAAFPVDGRVQAAEIQNSERVGAHIRTGVGAIDNARLTWGVQLRRDQVQSYGRVYSDRTTGKPIIFDHAAFYAQVDTRLASTLRLVGAVHRDRHSQFASRWSPKVALMYDLRPGQVLRVTYNGAYLMPTILQSSIYSLNAAAGLVSYGNTDGIEVRDGSGTLLSSVRPIVPETNETVELGYKGVLGERTYADVTVYLSRFIDFMAFAGPVADPQAATPTYGFNARTGERIEDGAGNPLRVFTYINAGVGRFAGMDVAMRYYLTERLALSTTSSLSRVVSLRNAPGQPPDAAAFNTSTNRTSLALEFTDLPRRWRATLRGRYVGSYEFRSGADWGRIPGHAAISATAGYRLESLPLTLLMQADNVATCVSGTSTPPAQGISATARATYTAGTSCGLGLRHHELLNMPAVGPMLMMGVRYEPF